jgi:hypothetical protein
LHRRSELPWVRALRLWRSGARPGCIGDRCDDAILELSRRLGPHLLGLEERAKLIELGALVGRQRLDLLAGQIRDPVLVAGAQHGSLSMGDAARRRSAPL